MRGSGFLKGAMIGGLAGGAVVAAAAAVAGTGIGAVFNLGQANSVDQTTVLAGAPVGKPLLKLANSSTAAGATALSLNVASGPPFSFNSKAKVANLNADKLDNLDSTAFLPNSIPLTLSGSQTAGSIVKATNTNNGGSGNGVMGVTDAGLASGVYGENSGGGYGIAGRTGSGTHGAVFGENTGGGPALELHSPDGGPPMTVDSTRRVDPT
jgi:hypothetical protein